ncbi:hypothetical protein FB451DRAFT_1190561 [Mycena latifolia]|nr:hypothetical protein FB451DRAFT_1190561 [Mycena latifolia]
MEAELPPINSVTAPAELAKALALEAIYKKNKHDKGRMGAGKSRLPDCGVPGCDNSVYVPSDPIHAHRAHDPRATINYNVVLPTGSPNDPPIISGAGGNISPGSSGNSGHTVPNTGGGNANPLIDTALNELPPAKRVRWAEGQRHRKIATVDPLEAVAESISGRMLADFVNGWLAHCTAIESADQSSTADTFPALCDAAADIIDAVLNVADNSGFSHEQFQWKMTAADGRLEVCHLVALHEWLVSTNLMVGDIQKKPAPAAKKGIFSPGRFIQFAKPAAAPVKIYDNGGLVTMTTKMLLDARLNASDYPGCVEAGMVPVTAVLKNRVCPAFHTF